MRKIWLSLLVCLTASGEVPSWFREVATAEHPKYPAQTKGVVLFHEERVQVEPGGKQTSQVRKAIKILNREGRQEAFGAISYDAKGSRVREFKAWLLYPTGKTKEFTKKDFVEGSNQASFELYSSQRYYSINASAEVDPGTVFGFEATLEEDRVFSQFQWFFQDDLPHLLSRYQLTVPIGWKAEAKAYQGASDKAEISGSSYTWEARKLGPLEREPNAPRFSSLVSRIAVSVFPPDGQAPMGGGMACFRTWKDVSQWKSGLMDPQAQMSAAIESKSAELTAGKANAIERIRALAEYVQQIRYVAISTNLSRGGGYVPHKADDVLRLAYGDCKDKANLLRTMLKTQKVISYPVAIYSGDPRFTVEDFPSPHQFNHAILAIRVAEDVQLPASFSHPKLGRLLLFDPTDAYVPFGFIPDHEQNSNALVTAGEEGGLIRTPQTKPGDNHTDRRWNLALDGEGKLEGQMVEVSSGQEAFDQREQSLRLPKEEYKKMLESLLSRTMTGAVIDLFAFSYEATKQEFCLELRFHASSYARVMKGKLWMVRSMPTNYAQVPNVNKSEREQALVLYPASFSERVNWKIPDTLKVDEMPEADKMESALGKFESWSKQSGDEIEVKRAIEIQSGVIPVAEYKTTRDFFMRFHGAGEARIVLVAK